MALWATHADESRMAFASASWRTLERAAARFISDEGMAA
jgi:hypothetical protein